MGFFLRGILGAVGVGAVVLLPAGARALERWIIAFAPAVGFFLILGGVVLGISHSFK